MNKERTHLQKNISIFQSLAGQVDFVPKFRSLKAGVYINLWFRCFKECEYFSFEVSIFDYGVCFYLALQTFLSRKALQFGVNKQICIKTIKILRKCYVIAKAGGIFNS